jgi:hypothetical protein
VTADKSLSEDSRKMVFTPRVRVAGRLSCDG